MPPARDQLRVAAVFLAALLGVHQLRYLIAFGGDAGAVLSRHGHGYLDVATFAVAGLGALACARLLIRVAAGGPQASPTRTRCARAWPAAAAGLLLVYTGQELLEGALSAGHPDWWTGVFWHGGWVAIPLACCFGAVVALVLRLADELERRSSAGWSAIRISPAPVVLLARSTTGVHVLLAGVLARHLAGRAPPRCV